jgi:UDP-N-acetylmuramoylalanine--D-glutamate ligase
MRNRLDRFLERRELSTARVAIRPAHASAAPHDMSERTLSRPEPARSRFEGLRVTVMGLGLFGGGAATARYLARRGARVTVTDLRSAKELEPALRELASLDLRFVLGEHREEDFASTDLVVANPAVAPSNRYLEIARTSGVAVTSETAMFLELCPARIAAVTGTQGKSSTCFTLAQLLEASGFTVHLGGNIGRSLIESAEEMRAEDVAVIELSSYQLEALPRANAVREWEPSTASLSVVDSSARPVARVEVVAVTNVLADHLERHGTIESYAAAKRRILELAARALGTAVLSAEDPRLATWREPGVRRVDVFATRASDRGLNFHRGAFRMDREVLGSAADLRLPGEFQRENTLVALGMARILGADPVRLSRAIGDVRALPHRLEDLGRRRGHRVWDNGVSTTPDSTISVLGSIAPGCTLMVGGKAKSLPLDELLAAARGRIRRVIAFGAAAPSFGEAFRRAGFEAWTAANLEDAVETAFARMEAGEELLFSPACASFDAYLNFKERAMAFRRALPPLDVAAAHLTSGRETQG